MRMIWFLILEEYASALQSLMGLEASEAPCETSCFVEPGVPLKYPEHLGIEICHALTVLQEL